MDIDSIYKDFRQKAEKSIAYVTQELRQIRTGQATPSLIEDLLITAYGGQAKLTLREAASIGTEGPTTLVIDPFDPSIVSDIERAIIASPLQLSPKVEGKIIRITTPPLTQEQRETFAKLAGQKVEEGKIQIRMARDDARKHIKALIDDKAISEDEKFRAEKEIDILTKEYTDKLDELRKRKHEDIMSV